MTILTLYEVIGLVITLLVALATYWRSKQDMRVAATALVTLLGAVLTGLVSLRFSVVPEIDKRVAFAVEISNSRSASEFAGILCQAERQVEQCHVALMQDVLQARLNHAKKRLREVARGEFSVEWKEAPEYAISMMEHVKASYVSTAYQKMDEWWDLPWGREFERANIEKARGGARIKRIFVFSSEEDHGATKALMKRQQDGGIDVKWVFTKDLQGQIPRTLMLIDDQYAGELNLPRESGPSGAVFYTRSEDIERIRAQIKRIESYSQRFRGE